MNHRLIYVVGPSGAGKDTLIQWLKARCVTHENIHWACRDVTRSAQNGSPHDQSVESSEFDAVEQAGGYALHWQAHDLKYGIRNVELRPLAHGDWVWVNGSRAYLPQCVALYPGLTVLHVSADVQILRRRLLDRGREKVDLIQARIERSAVVQVPRHCTWIDVLNNGTIEQAGLLILQRLQKLPGWPIAS